MLCWEFAHTLVLSCYFFLDYFLLAYNCEVSLQGGCGLQHPYLYLYLSIQHVCALCASVCVYVCVYVCVWCVCATAHIYFVA